MNKQTLFAITAGVAILFIMIAAIATTYRPTVHHEKTNQLRPKPAPYVATTPRSHPTVVTMGEKIKNKLNSHPKIIKIDHNGRDKSHYFNHEITVRFRKLPTAQELQRIERAIAGKLINQFDHFFIFRSNSKTYHELHDYFESIPTVSYSEPNYIYLQNEIPNDLLYSRYQWNLPTIDTEAGWRLSRGKKSVTIAIIDSGVDLDHPDLVHRLQKGYNVLANNNVPEDDNGHGTHVAGIIASQPNNGEGVAGMTWFNAIMPIKALNSEGYGTSFDVAKGIRWAVDHGARLVSYF